MLEAALTLPLAGFRSLPRLCGSPQARSRQRGNLVPVGTGAGTCGPDGAGAGASMAMKSAPFSRVGVVRGRLRKTGRACGERWVGVGDDGAAAMLEWASGGVGSGSAACVSCDRLHTIDLGRNTLGDTGAISVALALPAFTALTTLLLDANEFGGLGTAAVCAALGGFRSPAGQQPGSGAAGFPDAGVPSLTRLSLRGTQIQEAGCAALATALASPRLPVLRLLSLGGCGINDDGAAAVARGLARAACLQRLELERNPVRGPGVVALMSAIAKLYGGAMAPAPGKGAAKRGGRTREAAKPGQGARRTVPAAAISARFTQLVLDWCPVGAAGVAAIAECVVATSRAGTTPLTLVSLRSCGVDAETAEPLLNALRALGVAPLVNWSGNPCADLAT